MTTRADRRREQAEFKRLSRYMQTDFNEGAVSYRPALIRRSKYMPHIGKKQRAKGAALMALAA